MMTLCFTNFLCASVLMKIILHNVLNANEYEEIKDAFYFSNGKYTASLISGAKIIVVSKEFYYQLKTFIKHAVRLKLIVDDEEK